MTLPNPARNIPSVLPFALQRAVKGASQPIPMSPRADMKTHAARVITTTARHWGMRR